MVGDQGPAHPQHVRPVRDHLVQVHAVAGQIPQHPVAPRLDPGHRRAPGPLVVQFGAFAEVDAQRMRKRRNQCSRPMVRSTT